MPLYYSQRFHSLCPAHGSQAIHPEMRGVCRWCNHSDPNINKLCVLPRQTVRSSACVLPHGIGYAMITSRILRKGIDILILFLVLVLVSCITFHY